jgi:hypothetical protein
MVGYGQVCAHLESEAGAEIINMISVLAPFAC